MPARPSSGEISLSQVRTDLGTSGEIDLDDAAVRALTLNSAIYPASSEIKMSDLYYVAPGYNITSDVSVVDEGGTVVYSVTATALADGTVLYWTNSGTTSGGDFSNTSNFNHGSLTITGGVGSFSLVLANDTTTEGPQTIIINLRTTSISGTVVALAAAVTVNDLSQTPATPTYAIAPVPSNLSSVDEGGTVTYTVTTTNVPDGTLYWSTNGTVGAADFSDNSLTGTVTITSGSGTITRTLVEDSLTEGDQTMIMRLRTGSVGGTIVDTATTVTVNDTSQGAVAPTYAIAPVPSNLSSVNEGDTVTYTVTTTNVANGTLYWSTNGTVEAADFSDNSLTGTVTITSGSGTITRTLVADSLTDGVETMTLVLRTGSVSGTVVAFADDVTVNDTSQTPATPTYAIAPVPSNLTSVNEGGTVTYTVTTTNVANGTLYWATGGTVAAADFSDNSLTGTVTITSGSGTITRTLVADATTEGAQTMTLTLRTTSVTGTVVATAAQVTVNDTSQAPTYAIAPDVSSVDEGSAVTYTVTTTNVANGTLYWATGGTVEAADFSDNSLTGTVTITSGTGTITRTLVADLVTDGGAETMTLTLRTGSAAGTIVATAAQVTVNDISTNVYNFTITVGADVTSGGGVVVSQAGYRAHSAPLYGSISGDYVTPYGTITGCYSQQTSGSMADTVAFFVQGLSSVPAASTIYLGGSIGITFTWPAPTTGIGFYRWPDDPFAGLLAGTQVPCTITFPP